MNTGIYVISDQSIPVKRYKIGSHAGSLCDLKAKNIDNIPGIVFHMYLEVMDTEDTNNVISALRRIYYTKRVVNSDGECSDWYCVSFNDISKTIRKLLTISINDKDGLDEFADLNMIDLFTNEGIKLVDPNNNIAYGKLSDIPAGKSFDKYRELFMAKLRTSERDQKKYATYDNFPIYSPTPMTE